MTAMKIGEVAKRSSIGIETIRYYEREGLLLEPERRPSGYRQYDESTVERLEYIRRAKELGFTLAEIRELMELSFNAHAGCDHIRQRAEAKITDIEEKIRSLQQMKRSLDKIVQRCREKNSTDDCPLVHKPKRKTTQ
ncbi:MAG: MerR family transcriptional regulator [Gemmataceae bacterium]|nr:MerR family transcriptional regulator [Gemmataceae bacterium]